MIIVDSNLFIIHSIRKHEKLKHLIFRFRQYIKIKFFTISMTNIINELCVDNNIFISLTNKKFVINKCFNVKICRTIESIKIQNIEKTIHNNFEYVVMNFCIFDTIKKTRLLTHLKAEIYLIENLKVNILLRIDVLISKKKILNFERGKIIIFTCKEFEIDVITIRKFEKIIKLMRSSNKIIILIDVIISVSIYIKKITFSNNINYIFFFKIQLTLNLKGDFFAHVIEFKLIIVQIRNISKNFYVMFKNFRMSKLCDYAEENLYMI